MGNPHPVNAGKGRPKGSKNKRSAEVRAAAQVYTQESLRALVRLMRGQNVGGKGRSEVLPQSYHRFSLSFRDTEDLSLSGASPCPTRRFSSGFGGSVRRPPCGPEAER
jgi:hypothetical protein